MRTVFFVEQIRIKMITLLIFFCISVYAKAQTKSAIFDNAYFNQQPPEDTPTLFAPDIISNEFGNRDMAISPAGDEIFYTMQYARGLVSVIMFTKKVNGKWSTPEVASFSGIYSDLEPAFSPDGTKLFFVSNRSFSNAGKTKDYDIWFVTKTNSEWTNPQNVGAPVNSEKDEFYPSITRYGDIYFTRAVEGREEDILFCRLLNDKFEAAKALPDVINSADDEFNAFIDPDERFIIFSVYGRKDDNGGVDLYISRKNEGEWTQAVNMGTTINSKALDYCPYVTPDKKYFFFTSNEHAIKIPFDKKQNIKSLESILHSPLNGYDNIYWIKASAIIK
jgi:Tol biopolymer transport system component